MKRNILFAAFIFSAIASVAQNDRVTDDNSIIWNQLFATVRLKNNIDFLGEVQWRRTNGFSDPQQLLLRTGVQVRPNHQLSFAVGYAYVETYPYGDYPIAANGTFPEHRLHEQVQFRQGFGKLITTQRIRIEQRYIGRRTPASEREIEKWLFSNRFRYLLRMQHPVVTNENINLYVVAADEIFINAGKNVGVNIFDQNRLMFFLGSKLTNNISLETGYINQTLMQGRRINNSTIMQNNNGLVLALILTL
jgi:hypothetical protein